MSNVVYKGVAAKFASLSGRSSDVEIMKVFSSLSDRIESASGQKYKTVSVANAVNLERVLVG